MCNFIIRPVKCFATVNLSGEGEPVYIKAGDAFEVDRIEGRYVISKDDVSVPLDIFIHSFSLKDPNEKKKEEKKK